MADPSSMGEIGTGAGSGAVAGSTLGPYGAIAGAVIGAVGAGVHAYGAAKEGAAKANMYQYQAGVAKINQDIAKQNASWTRAAGEVSAERYGMKAAQERGEIRTIQSGSGIDVSTGSHAAVQDSQAEIVSHDLATIRSNAAHKAFGYDVEATGQEAQGKLFEMAASQSKTAGGINVASSLIGGASSLSSKWLQYRNMFGKAEPFDVTTGGGES